MIPDNQNGEMRILKIIFDLIKKRRGHAQLGAVFCRSYPRTEISRHNLHLRDVITTDKLASYRNPLLTRLSYVAPNNGEKTNKALARIDFLRILNLL